MDEIQSSRRLAALAGLLLLACAHGSAKPTASELVLAPGPFAVGHLKLTLVDTSRPTAANKSYKGAPSRTLPTRIWYPSAPRSAEALRPSTTPVSKVGGPHPLIVYSHGFMSFNDEGTYLAEHLASLGYIVVAANYPLTYYFAPGDPTLTDVVNQPGDVTFLINTLMSWSADPADAFAGAVDPTRIGVVGVSLGGLTSTLATFHPTLRDPRIAAGVSIAGPASMLGPAFFQKSPKPFMMIAGTVDALVPYDANARPLQERAPFATLVTLKDGSHTGFADISSLLFSAVSNPDKYGCNALMKNIGKGPSNEAVFGGLGGTEAGIVPMDPHLPCQQEELPRAMRPRREHALVILAATSFFQSLFAPDPTEREASQTFLWKVLAAENPDATVAPPLSVLTRP